jgi:hypothetical protein
MGPVADPTILADIQKTYRAAYKQYLIQMRDNIAESAKRIEEALTAIDKEEELEKKEASKRTKK